MNYYNKKFEKYGGLYEVIASLDVPLSPNKYYIYMGVKGQTPKVIKGSDLMKDIPKDPLEHSDGRMSRCSFVEDMPHLGESNGRDSRIGFYQETDILRFAFK